MLKSEPIAVAKAHQRLKAAIENPEYMMKHWIELPTSAEGLAGKIHCLSLKDAILLALRYNPNIQNAELDRVIQRYALRLAGNEFELQYALAASANVNNSSFSGLGQSINHSYLATPELGLKTRLGSRFSLKMDHNFSSYNNYSPSLSLSFLQPLLRGSNYAVNNGDWLNALDTEEMNKIYLRQTVIDEITQVITIYRALILSGYNVKIQVRQLEEAKVLYQVNEKRIAAGHLEPTGNIQQAYQIESLSLSLAQAENDLQTATQDLLQILGLDPKLRLILPLALDLKQTAKPSIPAAIKMAFLHNSQYLAQKMLLRADERAYAAAKDVQRWQLDLAANLSAGTVTEAGGSSSLYKGRNVDEAIGLNLTIPLRDLSQRNQLIAAKIRLEKDRLNLKAMERALITSITNIIHTVESQEKRYQLAKKQVKLAKESYDLEKKKQAAGIASALDLNNTQNQLIQAQAGLIGAKIAYLNQISTLERLLGTTLDVWEIKLSYGA